MTGYHALVKGGAVTVFGPDGTEIASARRASGYGSAIEGRVGDTRLVADGIGDGRLETFAELAARHHRAVADPGARDRVWVRWESDGVAAVYGTDKYDDDDLRAVKAGNLYWSGQRQARTTGRRWNPDTRDRNLAAVLKAFARQDRNIVVLGPGQTLEDLPSSPTPAAKTVAAAVPVQQAPPADMPPAPEPAPEPAPVQEPEDLTALSDEELLAAEDATATARRAHRYSSDAPVTAVEYQRLRQEIGRRLVEQEAAAPSVTELNDEELAAERTWWKETIGKTSFHSSDEEYRTLERRRDAVVVEQNGRTARVLLAGPRAADLDDEALESAYEQIGPVWTKLPGGTELNDQVTAYRKSLQEERVARRARSYGERTPVGEMTMEELIVESADLGSHLAARNEQSAYSYSEAVKDAREKRLRAVEDEWDQRGLEQNPDAARAVLGDSLGGKRQVLIDGSERSCAYGYVERRGKKFRALADWDERSGLGDFDSGPAAMAALVQRYDQDPKTRPRRTWGNTREVDLPSSSYDPLVSWLRRRPSELSREYDRVLDLLTPYEKPTQTKVLNPLTNQVMRAYPFFFEEGLLGELSRIAERTTEDLREQSLNEQLPKREREAAKRRIPAMGAALIGINTVIEQVRAAGGDVERRGVDQGRLAAQMAALAGSVDEREGGESDGGEQPVRDTAAAALGGVPAAGAGGDGGSGAVLQDAGDADGRGDRRGGGGPGGGAGAGDGVPGPGRADGADLGDGAGAGPARDAAAAGGRGGPGGAAESGSGGAGVDPQGAGEPVATRRFRPDPADLPRGPLARAEANLAALKVLRTLERENRGTTVGEARTLARWSGWGSVPTVFLEEPDPEEPIYGPGGDREGGFETDHAAWEAYSRVRGELRGLLNPFEWRAASRAVLSAHYTPQAVAESMWQGLAAFGFDGGEVLEAGCGSGAFFGVAPPAARLTGVELDPTTAAIAGRIYPHANVLAESFTDTDVPLGTFDAAIGNVPFASAPFGEKRYRAGGHSLHNGFIIKQLALLRPGAYMTVITSRWTLDGEDTAARRDMSRWGDLAAAYRLPKGTFGETADTDVVADVLVFRRRAEGEEPRDLGWIEAPERELGGNTVTVNAYFTEHPEHVLGRLTTEQGPYGPRVTVQGEPGRAPGMLRERMGATAAAAVADGLGYVPHEDWPHREPLLLQTARLKHATDFTGRLYADDSGAIWQHVNGADPVRVITADGVSGTDQLRTLLTLRDVAGELQELDRTGQDLVRAREVRDQLARLHASYTEKHGPLSRPRQTRLALPSEEAVAAARAAGVELGSEDRLPTGWGWFRQDPNAAAVLGLEHWDRANARAVNSEVLTRRPGTRRGNLEPTDDPKTALTAVMGATGRVDLPLIASLLGTTTDEARARLGTEVFDNPVTKKLEHAGKYLSGAVREKLEQAREAAATDPKYAVNVAALEVVQPPPKRLGQFTAQLGAHWIPAPLVQGFLREYLGDPTLQVSHNERYGWSLAAGKVPDAINALKGTERRSAVHIAKALLGRASTVVNLLDDSGVDEDATRAMRHKADAMRSAFEEFCTASTQRVTQLTDAYNRQMNGHVVRSYDNLAPTLEGFTTERTPHPWQLSGAARMQFERGVILAHEMGLGKTTTMVMGTQALKASGQIAKPFVVVQSGLGRQWLDEATLLYRNADIRLITSADLADGNRRPVLEWLRANSPDLVIFTEGAFQSIRMSPEQQELYLFRELESLKEQLERERGIPHNAFALMKLEQRLATVESRIRRNDSPMRTPGEVYWDDLGFDYACIDEAHRFTAVGFRSKEAGGETASVRAVDLHQKLSWHHRMAEYDGGRPTVTLGTGTPMENSIFEQYSGLELATPWLLDQFGVHGPDLWAETFGQKVQRIEQAPDGSGLTIVERFSRFVSKATMKTMWGLATDTKTGDDVGIERPRLAGGAPQLVLVEPTPDQRTRLQSLVVRGQAIHAGDVTRDEDNMLAVTHEGRAVALDPRLVDAAAPAGNKLIQAADIIAAGYHAHKNHIYADSDVPGGLFFVFANSGTPGGQNKGGFNLYAELRDLLAARGVPRDMVQFAQDHRTPEQKAEMTRAANNGGIAVLMGSSEVLGTGFNGQNRAYALMHLDQDWTPALMMQRNFRVLRPGNQHEEVSIYFLATKESMDAWQVGLLTSKAEGLRDIQRPPGVGDDDSDTVEEIGESDWDYATMAAEIGGNPYMRQFMEAKVHLQGLEADRRNAAADRVRQMELLGTKEGELAVTRAAIAAREKALPKITETIRGNAFRIRIGGREFEKFGEAAPVLRQAVTEAVRAYQNEGRGPWRKLGTFGGLDFAVQPEVAHGSGEIHAYIGFPELRHSESRCSVEDLVKGNIGATMLGRLATSLEKAEDHQLMDRERLPVLEQEVAVLTALQEAVNYGPAIEHARRRVELLDGIVGAITERDKIPELTESMLDQKKHPTDNSRKKALQENAEKRAPHQANVDAAAARLAAFDAENPAPEPVVLVNTWPEGNVTDEAFEQWRERQRIIIQQNREAGLGIPIPEDASAPALKGGTGDTAASEPASSSGRSAESPEPTPEPEGEGTEEPGEQIPEPSGDAVGPARPDRVPVPASWDEPEPEPEPESEEEADEPVGVPEGQMTVEEVAAGPSQVPPSSPEGSAGQDAPEPEAAADPYGTADLFDEFGLPRPERVPAADPQDDSAPEEPQEDADGVPEGQMTVDDAAPADPASDDQRERLTSADGRLTFTLLRLPADHGRPDLEEGYQKRRAELLAAVDSRNAQNIQSREERDQQLAEWQRGHKAANGLEPWRPAPAQHLTPRADRPGLTPAEYALGSWVTWKDTTTGTQVTGQVTAPGPVTDTWYVSTDRTGVTGEYHVLSRTGQKKTGYSYSIGGDTTDLQPAAGPPEPLPFDSQPAVDAIPARPVASYADHVPGKGLSRVRPDVPVTVGPDEVRTHPAGVVFSLTVDGIPFTVAVDQHQASGRPLYKLLLETGESVRKLGQEETRAGVLYTAVLKARSVREVADKPLHARGRDHRLDLVPDGVCARCHQQFDGNVEQQELYRVEGGDPMCSTHLALSLDVSSTEVEQLGTARRIWAARTAPEPPADTTPTAPAPEPSASTEPPAPDEPRLFDRTAVGPGARIVIPLGTPGAARLDREVPGAVQVTGTLSPAYRGGDRTAVLLDPVIHDSKGTELPAADYVTAQALPAQVQLAPNGHREDLRPQIRTAGQIRLGDLIAEGGTRGEVVTEVRYALDPRGATAFSTRDVATGRANNFSLLDSREILVVPRERRRPQDVAEVFGRHHSRFETSAQTRQTLHLHTALEQEAARLWPDSDGPQDELRTLRQAIAAIDPEASGGEAYRANAATTAAAAAAATVLFDAVDDTVHYRGLGEPLRRLRQHLDVQMHRLHADVAYLTARAAAAPAANPGAADEPIPHVSGKQGAQDQSVERTQEGEDVASQGTGETEQLGLFGDPAAGPGEPERAMGGGVVPADGDGKETQLRAALIQGETIAPATFTDQREPTAGWILTTAGGHTFRLRQVKNSSLGEDQWEAGHDADGTYWWNVNLEDRPLTAVLARIREDSATRTRFASLWDRYGHLAAQAPPFQTTTDRVQLEEGVYLVSRFGSIGLIASCRWGWEHLTDPDGAQGHTSEDWRRKGPDNRQYVAEWQIWHSAQEAVPNTRLRVVARLTDSMADTPDAYCDASTPYVGKCSTKRSGARYTVAVDTDQGSELGHYTVCARCLSQRLLTDEDRHIGHHDVESLVQVLAKGDPKVVELHWKQWPDRIAELAGQMLSAALDAGESAPWPAQALTSQILAEACEAGDDRAMRETRAKAKAAGGGTEAQKKAAAEVAAARRDRATLAARRGAAHKKAANETDPVTVAILGLAGWEVEGSGAAAEPAPARRPLPAGMRWVHRDDVRPGDVVRFERDGELRDPVLIRDTAVPHLLHYEGADRSSTSGSWSLRSEYVVVVDTGPDRTSLNRYIRRFGDSLRNELAAALDRWEERRAAQTKPAADEPSSGTTAEPGAEGTASAAPEPAEETPVVVDVNTLTVSPRELDGEPSPYQFTVTGPGLTVGRYDISHDAQGKGARGIIWRAYWHGEEPSGRWDVINIGSGEGKSAALSAVAEHAAKAGGDLTAGFAVARRMNYDAGLWLLPDVGESETIQRRPDGSWTITAETGALYTVRREWRGRTASGDLAPLLIEDQTGTLIASCTAVDSYMSAWAPMLERLRLHATAVADGAQHATAVTLGGPGRDWVEAWCVCSWTERADVAMYADSLPAGEALAQAHHPQPPTAGAAPRPLAAAVTPTLDDAAQPEAAEVPPATELPELDVVLLKVDVPPLDPAEPYSTDEEAQADIDRLGEAFARWDALPTVQRYYDADRQQRPDGRGAPTNPVAQLAQAYQEAGQSLRDGAVSPDDLVLQVHTVAVWSGTLETLVGEDLRSSLGEVREAATLLAARSQATVAAFEAELAALAANSAPRDAADLESTAAEPEHVEQAPVDADDEPEAPVNSTESGPGEPATDTDAAESAADAPAETDDVMADPPAPDPDEAPEHEAAVPGEDTQTMTSPEPGASPDPAAVPDQAAEPTDTEAGAEQPGTEPATATDRSPGTGSADIVVEAEPVLAPAAEDAVQVEDPPEARPYTEVVVLAGDSGYALRLSGVDGQGPSGGELLHEGTTVAALVPSASGRWFARLTVEGLPGDVTVLSDSPAEAAHRGAILFSARTATPYGQRPVAAVADGPLSRADRFRLDLRDAAESHLATITRAAARVRPDYQQIPQFRGLHRWLTETALADSDTHGSWEMTSHLAVLQESVMAWSTALPDDVALDERQHLAYPLAHLLYDVRLLAERLRLTLEAAQAEQPATREQAAEATAAPAPAPADAPQAAPPAPTPRPAAPKESTMATPQEPDSGLPPVPPAAQPITAVTSLPEYAQHRLHLTGDDRIGFTTGELRRDDVVIATVHRTTGGRWFAQMPLDIADITTVVDTPEQAARMGAVMHAVLTGAPLGEPVTAAEASNGQSRSEQVWAELRRYATGQAQSIEAAARQLSPNYLQNPHYTELAGRLAAAADVEGMGPRQLTGILDAIEEAATAWGSDLPLSASSEIRTAMAYPLTELLYETRRLRERVQATAQATQVGQAQSRSNETVAAAPASATPLPATQQAPQGPTVMIGLYINGPRAEMGLTGLGGNGRRVLQGVAPTDVPTQALGVSVEIPMPVRSAERANQLISSAETEAWLAAHLPQGPLAQAWGSPQTRAALVVALRDSWRYSETPPAQETARWLVTTSVGHDDLIRMAHQTPSLAEFRDRFAQAAAALVAAGGSEHVKWAYEQGMNSYPDLVLDQAAGRAYRALRNRPLPSDAAAPAPSADAKDSDQQAPAPDAPEATAAPATPEGPAPGAAAPLWGTDDLPVSDYTQQKEDDLGQPSGLEPMLAGESAFVAAFSGFLEAWAENVPDGVPSEQLRDEVHTDLTTLQAFLSGAVDAAPAPAPAQPVAARDGAKEAAAVNAALRHADTRVAALQDLPEWQKVQTVRGAMGHLLTTIRERAGERLDKLLGDKRAGGFLRELSARACDKIAGWAQAGARKLRGEDARTDERGDLPTAETLLNLGVAASAYSAPRRPGPTAPPVSADLPSLPAMRKMGEALAKPMPGRPTVSTAAARSRSKTAAKSPVKKPADSGQQPGHVRRGTENPAKPRKPQR
ncbi:hypothetical protein [Streptomyces hydrogenans]|uniref:hypothetical protein n=1 Tax=Streptomyces hydrogenans TaxID=1873719 RepID=UPI0036E7B6BB